MSEKAEQVLAKKMDEFNRVIDQIKNEDPNKDELTAILRFVLNKLVIHDVYILQKMHDDMEKEKSEVH